MEAYGSFKGNFWVHSTTLVVDSIGSTLGFHFP